MGLGLLPLEGNCPSAHLPPYHLSPFLWAGWQVGWEGVTLQPPFPGLDLDLEAPLLLNVWQPHEALPGRCYLKHGKNPCVLCQQSEVPRCAARPSGIFRWPPLCRAAMGCRLSWPWARGAPFHVEEMLPLGGGVGKGKLNRKCPIYSELVMLGGSWIP